MLPLHYLQREQRRTDGRVAWVEDRLRLMKEQEYTDLHYDDEEDYTTAKVQVLLHQLEPTRQMKRELDGKAHDFPAFGVMQRRALHHKCMQCATQVPPNLTYDGFCHTCH